MRNRKFLAAAGVTAALVAGGATALILGTPGVSGAQTSGSAPTTVAPNTGNGGSGNTGGSGGMDGHHCTNMGGSGGPSGTAPSSGAPNNTATQLGFHHFRGGYQ